MILIRILLKKKIVKLFENEYNFKEIKSIKETKFSQNVDLSQKIYIEKIKNKDLLSSFTNKSYFFTEK